LLIYFLLNLFVFRLYGYLAVTVPERERGFTMTFPINRIFGFVMLAALAGACVSQAAVQARFHLPVTAQWGKTVLAPGDYKIVVLDDIASGRNQLVIEGEGKSLHELPVAVDLRPASSPSSLELIEVNGNYFVREYKSGFAGKTFTFGVPKQVASHHTKTVQIAN
jgi:hypothetical protein